jgi:hypothetical protein
MSEQLVVEYFEPPLGMRSSGYISSARVISLAPLDQQAELSACQSPSAAQGRHQSEPITGYLIGLDLKTRGSQPEGAWEALIQSEDFTRFYVWPVEEKSMSHCLLPYLKSGKKGRFYLQDEATSILSAVRP